jgi:hypothetical protein
LEFPLVFFAFGLVTPFVVLCFVGFYWNRERGAERVAQVWEAYARQRRFTFLAPSGYWPNRTPPRIEWSEDGHAFRIEARGVETIASTRVVGRPAVPILGELLVTPSSGEAARRPGAMPLDGRLFMWAQPEGFADRLLTNEVKRALLGFVPISLLYRRGEVSLGWAGGEENDARLDEARAVVRRILDAMAR